MIIETVCLGEYEANCYILAQDINNKAIIIDPGDEPGKIKTVLSRKGLIPAFVINTHGHIDHIGADDAFAVPVYIHEDDKRFLTDDSLNLSSFLGKPLRINNNIRTVKDGQYIQLGKIRLEVLHTPGHTPGGICLLLKDSKEEILFSGDTLFRQSVGRTDLPFASTEQLTQSIRNKLFVLDDKTTILPGHGPATTIGEEKENNPFLG